MVRWTEENDVLRLTYSHTLEAFVSALFALLSGIVVVACVVTTVQVAYSSSARGFLWIPIMVGVIFLPPCIACCHGAANLRDWAGWVEIAIRGGYARWGGGGGTPVPEMLAVRRFELVQAPLGWSAIDAVLHDHRRLPVLGPWPDGLARKAQRIVRQLNENLGEIDGAPPRFPATGIDAGGSGA